MQIERRGDTIVCECGQQWEARSPNGLVDHLVQAHDRPPVKARDVVGALRRTYATHRLVVV